MTRQVFAQQLSHPEGQTAIRIGAGELARIADWQAEWFAGRTVFVLSTPRLRQLFGDRLAIFDGLAARIVELEVEDGEGAKTLEHAGRLWREMLAAGGKRDSRLITFGGGSVGDLGGFVAGCFLRGIAYAQVPTTLLAQVDAAIGGKTAIDLDGGKNTVGLFNHPDWVLSDTSLLTTLPRDELRSGLVEVVKMAFLLDVELLARVEAELEPLLEADADSLAPVVALATAAKVSVVESDPEERDLRRLLNFGHTLGHAIEGLMGYRGLRHGEAVAYGMLFALRLAEHRGLGVADADRLRHLLARFNLPPLPDLDPDHLASFMTRDKKATEKGLAWVLPKSLGQGEIVGIDPAVVRGELRQFLTSLGEAAPP